MKNRAWKATQWIILGVTACASMLMPSSLPAAPQKAGRAQEWKVKESTQRLSISEEYLAFSSGEEETEFVPLASITELRKETLIRRPVRKAIKDLKKEYKVDWNDVGEAIVQDPRMAMLAPALPVVQPLTAMAVQAMFAPFSGVKVNQHFVHISWNKGGEEQSRIFRLSNRDADSLLVLLQKLTGKTPSQINVLEAIDKGSGKMMVFKVHASIVVGKTYLPPGNYRLLLVETSAVEGVLYVLLRGSLESGDILAIVPVTISAAGDIQTPNARFEADLLGAPHLVELKFGSRLLHLSGVSGRR